MTLILICIAFYIIGSFPTAYLLVKYKYKKNIIAEGSGNAGARNTIAVTRSIADGVIVLLTDLLKGLLPVLWFIYYSGQEVQLVIFPALMLIAGHNFSIWLKFKGGRGLATGAGIMLAVNFLLVVIWLILYFILNRIIRNVHVSTVIALIILPLSIIFLQGFILKYNNPVFASVEDPMRFLFAFCSSVCIVILLKHITPILDLIRKKRSESN